MDIDVLLRFAASLGIGLLLGLERERIPGARAGIRTFALVGLLGTLCALISERPGGTWLLPAVALALAVMMISLYHRAPVDESSGGTSLVSLLVCFALGAVTWYGYRHAAVTIALVVTGLLYFRAELHTITHHLSRQDWMTLFQFAVVTFVVLPVLPDVGFGPLLALNPYRIWLMVVLISGMSFAGYVALRVAGERRALPLIGIFGGLVSSAATTLTYSRNTRGNVHAQHTALLIVLTANTVVLVKMLVIACVIAPQVLPRLAPVFGAGLLAGALQPFLLWRKIVQEAELPHPDVGNPSELRVAITFGAVFALVLLATAWLNRAFGASGFYAAALASGFTDIDAITLSALQLVNAGSVSTEQAVNAMAIAFLASEVLKFCIVGVAGGRAFAGRSTQGYLATGIAMGLVLLLESRFG